MTLSPRRAAGAGGPRGPAGGPPRRGAAARRRDGRGPRAGRCGLRPACGRARAARRGAAGRGPCRAARRGLRGACGRGRGPGGSGHPCRRFSSGRSAPCAPPARVQCRRPAGGAGEAGSEAPRTAARAGAGRGARARARARAQRRCTTTSGTCFRRRRRCGRRWSASASRCHVYRTPRAWTPPHAPLARSRPCQAPPAAPHADGRPDP